MSVFPNDTINLIAESAGIVLKPDAASVLAQDMEYRLREIIHVHSILFPRLSLNKPSGSVKIYDSFQKKKTYESRYQQCPQS
jgi:hypothetical protein